MQAIREFGYLSLDDDSDDEWVANSSPEIEGDLESALLPKIGPERSIPAITISTYGGQIPDRNGTSTSQVRNQSAPATPKQSNDAMQYGSKFGTWDLLTKTANEE